MKTSAALLWLLLAFGVSDAAEHAETVLRHGRIYTMDAARSWVESVAIQKGKIVFAGEDRGVQPWIGKNTQVIELEGRYAMPSFIDAHVHPVTSGLGLNRLDLSEFDQKEAVMEAVKQYAESHKDLLWVVGSGWALPVFPNANPQKEWLDAIVADRPVLLEAADGHSVWVNSKALETAGVTRETPDPEGGRIERNEKGEPSGTLRETAVDLVYRLAPRATLEEQIGGLQQSLMMMNRYGITGFNDASVSEEELIVYQQADQRGLLTARVAASMYADPEGKLEFSHFDSKGAEQKPAQPAPIDKRSRLEKVLDQTRTLKEWRDKYHSRNFRATTIKLFIDGVIEANTAAMLQPYLDKENDAGKLLWEPELLNPFVELIDREGFQPHFHAIGDRAVRTALNSVESARKANGPRDARPYLAHIEVIDPTDIPRFAQIGALPCFQPLWAYEDSYITDLTLPKMSRDRWRWIYPIASAARSGAVLTMGSDWSVSSANPLEGIEVAVTRMSAENAADAKPVFIPEERISVAQGLAAYTIGSAFANFWEREAGSIEIGKSADLIVLSRNPFTIEPSQLSEISVLLTLFRGKTVYRDPLWR